MDSGPSIMDVLLCRRAARVVPPCRPGHAVVPPCSRAAVQCCRATVTVPPCRCVAVPPCPRACCGVSVPPCRHAALHCACRGAAVMWCRRAARQPLCRRTAVPPCLVCGLLSRRFCGPESMIPYCGTAVPWSDRGCFMSHADLFATVLRFRDYIS